MAETNIAAAADKPLTMILDDGMPPPPQQSVDEQQLLLQATPTVNGGVKNENGGLDGTLREGGAGKRGPWPGKKCAVAMIADQAANGAANGVDARPYCVDAQPLSNDAPEGPAWCTNDEEPGSSRCENCVWSFWICMYAVLSCCEYPCK